MSQPTNDQPTQDQPTQDELTQDQPIQDRPTGTTTELPVTDPPPAETLAPQANPVVLEPETRPLRMRTVVLGVILLAVATLSLIDTTTSMNVDLGTTVLALMIGCGVLLIVGARRE